MKIERCANGHYYDGSRYSCCPHCGESEEAPVLKVEINEEKQMPISVPQAESAPVQQFAAAPLGEPKSEEIAALPVKNGSAEIPEELVVTQYSTEIPAAPVYEAPKAVYRPEAPAAKIYEEPKEEYSPFGSDDAKTVGIFASNTRDLDLTGWLVCRKGPGKGTDYHIFSGRNRIGGGRTMEVSMWEDRQIVEDNHVSLIYDPKNDNYWLIPGTATAFVNGELLIDARMLADYDIIGLGESELVFIPYCKSRMKW